MRHGSKEILERRFNMAHKYSLGMLILKCLFSTLRKLPIQIVDVNNQNCRMILLARGSHSLFNRDINIGRMGSLLFIWIIFFYTTKNIIVIYMFLKISLNNKKNLGVHNQFIDHLVLEEEMLLKKFIGKWKRTALETFLSGKLFHFDKPSKVILKNSYFLRTL